MNLVPASIAIALVKLELEDGPFCSTPAKTDQIFRENMGSFYFHERYWKPLEKVF